MWGANSFPPMAKWATPLGFALLCGHCALGALLSLAGAVGLLAVPTLFGVSLNWFWPPVAILGAFSLWLWTGREQEEACAR